MSVTDDEGGRKSDDARRELVTFMREHGETLPEDAFYVPYKLNHPNHGNQHFAVRAEERTHADYVSKFVNQPQMYVHVNGSEDVPSAKEGRLAQKQPNEGSVLAAYGLSYYADVDFNDDERWPELHKEKALPSLGAALHLIEEMPLAPTMVVHSGHGLQAWWLLDEVVDLRGEGAIEVFKSEQRAWQALLRAKAREYGWTIDSVHDVARLMRLPGTFNQKRTKDGTLTEKVPTRLLDGVCGLGEGQMVGERVERGQVRGLVDTTATVAPRGASGGGGSFPDPVTVDGLTLDPRAMRNEEKWEQLVALGTGYASANEYERLWRGESRTDDKSPSSCDMSLANDMALGGWTPQEIADALIHRRRDCGADLKIENVSYWLTTTGKAKSNAEVEQGKLTGAAQALRGEIERKKVKKREQGGSNVNAEKPAAAASASVADPIPPGRPVDVGDGSGSGGDSSTDRQLGANALNWALKAYGGMDGVKKHCEKVGSDLQSILEVAIRWECEWQEAEDRVVQPHLYMTHDDVVRQVNDVLGYATKEGDEGPRLLDFETVEGEYRWRGTAGTASRQSHNALSTWHFAKGQIVAATERSPRLPLVYTADSKADALWKRYWRELVDDLVDVAKPPANDDLSALAGRMREVYLPQYLEYHPAPNFDEVGEDVSHYASSKPYIQEGRMHINLSDLLNWVTKAGGGEKGLSLQDLARAVGELGGVKEKQIQKGPATHRVKRRYFSMEMIGSDVKALVDE